MGVFEYKVTSGGACAASGTIVADSPRHARDLLRDRGLTVSLVRPVRPSRRRSGRARASGQVEAIAFVRELATLLMAAIPLLEALKTLARQHGRKFRSVIEQMSDRIASGVSLADAMAEHDAWFDAMCVNIVRVGENAGCLEMGLTKLAALKEKTHRLRSRVTSALIYPAIVFVVGMAVTVFLMTYVVPNLLTTLKQAQRDLPAVTLIVQSISDAIRNWWWAILACVMGLAVILKAVLASEKGHSVIDRLVLRLPLIGDLVRKENTSRMAVMLASLLRGGLQFVDAVAIARQTLRNRPFREALDGYARAVAAGKDISAPLENSKVFPPMVVQILAVGQQTGNLEEMLEHLSEAYDQEVAIATTRLTAVLEPFLIVVLAAMVGFIAFATILPILEMSNVL